MKKELKVAQVIRRFSFQEWGGTENVVWNSSLALRPHNVVSKILATSALDKTGSEFSDDIEIERFKYFYPYWPLSKNNRFDLDKKGGAPYSRALSRELIKGDYQLIHVHSGGRVAQLALSGAKKAKLPIVFSIHGGFADVPKAELEQMLKPVRGAFHYGNIIDRFLGWRRDIIKEVDAVICVGTNEYNILKEEYPKKRILNIPNGVNIDKFANVDISKQQEFRKKYNIPQHAQILLCVSRIDYQKNQLLLLKLLTRLKHGKTPPHLLLIGPITSQKYYQKMQEKISEYNLQKHLTIIPGLPPNSVDLIAAYKSASLFLLPSLHEPFGIVLLEAWAAGLPIISTKIGGAGLLIDNMVNGLIADPKELEEWVNLYLFWASNHTLNANLISEGKKAVKQYSWSKIADELDELYHNLV